MEDMGKTEDGAQRLERSELGISRARQTMDADTGARGVTGAMGVRSDEAPADPPGRGWGAEKAAYDERLRERLEQREAQRGGALGYREPRAKERVEPQSRRTPDEHGEFATADGPMDNADGDMEVGYTNTETIAGLRKRLHREGAACEAEEQDAECMSLIAALGGEPKSFKRERKRALRNIVSEIYSPPRVASMLTTFGKA